METIEGNRLIAEFMGVPEETAYGHPWYDGFLLDKAGLPFNYGAMGNGTGNLKFRYSWDWLMPVVEKIENTKMINGDWFMVSIGKFKATIMRKDRLSNPYFDDEIYHVDTTTKIDATWNAVVEFIEWYNAHK